MSENYYTPWIKSAREEARFKFKSADRAFSALENKTSVYGRSIEAMRDLRLKSLQLFEAAPDVLPSPPQPEPQKPMALEEADQDMDSYNYEIDGMSD